MATYQDDDGRWHYRRRIGLPDGRHIRIKGTPNTNTERAADAAERAHIERAELEAMAAMRGFVASADASAPVANTNARASTAPLVRDFIKRFVAEYAPDGKHGGTRTRNIHL